MGKGFPGGFYRQRKNKAPKKLRQVFGGEGTEPLTDELIEKLVKKGWEREQLLYHRSNGGVYSIPRDSVLYPPEFGSY